MRNSKTLLLMGLIVFTTFSMLTSISFSQGAYPTRLILPQAYSNSNEMSGDLPISIGPFDNYLISPTNGFLETDICVNPRNPNNFVCTDNRITGFVGSPYVYYTTDGGVTWNAAICGSGNYGDPAFTADSLGNFYLAALSYSGVWVYKSTNGGASWSAPITGASSTFADKEWIAADQTTGPYQNNVYIAFVDFAIGAPVVVTRSTNNGTSWFNMGTMGSGTPNPGPDIAVGPDGRVVLAWYAGSGAAIRVSTDGGSSFSASVYGIYNSWPGNVNCSGRNVLKDFNNSYGFRVQGFPHMAIDMTNGPRRGYVYLTAATNPSGPDAADILFTRSTDGGLTWNSTSPLRVNDDATTTDQWQNDVSVDNQGRVWVFWFDSRDDPNNVLTWTYGAVSTNGGVSFSPNFRLSNQSFNYQIVRIIQPGSCHYYMGDYQGMSGKTMTFPCWYGQNNTRQDFTAYLPDFGLSFQNDPLVITPGATLPNRVRIPLMGPYAGTVTLSAAVTPPPSQGTITFTWSPGNVRTINGSPDSVLLNVVASANVSLGNYTVNVTGTESAGPRTHTRPFALSVVLGVVKNEQGVPKEFKLEQNYPNPFNPTTTINFGLPKASFVTLKIYDILGNEVKTVANENMQAGSYTASINLSELSSGIYFYKLEAGDFKDVKRMMLVK